MKVTKLVLVALMIMGLALGPVVCQGSLAAPKGCSEDGGSSDEMGHTSCSSGLAGSKLTLDFGKVFEALPIGNTTIQSMEDLATFVYQNGEKALGYPTDITDKELAEVSQIFRIRHMPDPSFVAQSAPFNELERLVKTVVTHPDVKDVHTLRGKEVQEIVDHVVASLQSANGFVFRILEGSDSEYPLMRVHQLGAVQAFFAAVRSGNTVYVSIVGMEISGEFRRGHGDKTLERSQVDFFIRQWLLNQWVNLWICPRPIVYNGI